MTAVHSSRKCYTILALLVSAYDRTDICDTAVMIVATMMIYRSYRSRLQQQDIPARGHKALGRGSTPQSGQNHRCIYEKLLRTVLVERTSGDDYSEKSTLYPIHNKHPEGIGTSHGSMYETHFFAETKLSLRAAAGLPSSSLAAWHAGEAACTPKTLDLEKKSNRNPLDKPRHGIGTRL